MSALTPRRPRWRRRGRSPLRERRDNLRLLVGDVYHLGFTDASFDVVHAHQLLQHLANPVAALREMRRVCAPGGIVAARDADYAAMTWHPPSAAISRWLALYHEVARVKRGRT